MTQALNTIQTEKFPLTLQRKNQLKTEIIEAAESFENLGHPLLAVDLYKAADALDSAMAKIIEAERQKL